MKSFPFCLMTATLFICSLPPLTANQPAHGEAPAGESLAGESPAAESPLTPQERALFLDARAVKLDSHGQGYLIWKKEPVTVELIEGLSPWDLMHIFQALSGSDIKLSRFGRGGNDELTQAWREKLAEFVVSRESPAVEHQEDLFDPELVLWDPGYIQNQNEWGQWFITLDRRQIVQKDLGTLSPLELQQAVFVLTNRTYPIEFVLEHLESFRAQLTVHQRLAEVSAAAGAHGHE